MCPPGFVSALQGNGMMMRMLRTRNDDEDTKEELYSYITVGEVPSEGFVNLGTKVVDEDD